MKNPQKAHRESRRPDSGSITVIAVALLTALMGMAALAVDMGFLFTRARMMHAVADSAVAIAMNDVTAGANSATITTDITNIAGQYPAGMYSISSVVTAVTSTTTQVQVTVTHTYPLFFAKVLGLRQKLLTVVATGVATKPSPAILALANSGCSSGGISFNGSGGMTVKGDVQSMGPMNFWTGTPGGVTIDGSAQAECATTKNPWDTVTGSFGAGGPFTDPYNPYTVPIGPCSGGGSTTTAYFIPSSSPPWNLATTPPTLAPGIYCSSGDLNLTGPGTGFTATNVTLISGGAITISASTASSITANPASPNGIVAYSTGTGTPAIFVGGPSAQTMTIGGALYAPSGQVSVQSNGPMTSGPLVGASVFVGDYASWTINANAGGAPNGWRMTQ